MNISTLISNDGEDTRNSQNLNAESLEVSEEVAQHESPLSTSQLTNPVACEQISISNDALAQFPPNSENTEMMFDPGDNSGNEDSSGLFIQEGNTPQLEDMYPNGEPSYEVGSPGLGTPQQLTETPINDRIQTPETDEIGDDSKVESPSSCQKTPPSTEYETNRKWTDQKVLMQSPEPMESSNPDLTNEGIVDSSVESPIELKTQSFSTNTTKVSQIAARIPLPPVKKRHLLSQYRNSMSFEEETVSKANLDITYDNESSHTERIRDSSLDHSDSEDKEISIESEPEIRHTYGGKLPITHGVAPSHQSSTCSSSSSSEEDVLDGTQGQKRLKSNHGTQKMLHELSDSENSNSDSSGSVDLGTGAGGKTVTDLIHRSHSFSTVTRQPRPVRRATIAKSRESSYEMNENSGVESEKLPPSRAVEPCYCGDMTKLNEHNRLPSIKCSSCRRRCHLECIHYTQPFVDNLLLGDDFYFFKCHECNGGKELFQRLNLSWVDVVHIALFNLTHGEPTCNIKSYEDGRLYFHVKQEVCRFVNEHWDRFWNKIRSETWQNSVAGTLSTNSTNGRFESGNQKYDKTGMWALSSPGKLPSQHDTTINKKARFVAFTVTEEGELKDTVETLKRKQRMESISNAQNRTQARVKRTFTGAEAHNRRKSKLKSSITIYPDIENPSGPVMMCSHETHSAPQFKIASDGLSLWNEKGYRLSKATHGVEYGAWYYEVEILPHTGNTRIGWSQISGDLQGPCGFDRFSYSYREKPGSIFHESVGKQYGDGAETGDVIGLLIYIPELSLDEKRDLLSRRWSLGEKYIEYSYFPTNFDESKDDPSLVTLPKVEKSQIVYFKNGECMGVAFENINLGKYHPAISSYKGGRVAVNFGPMFKYPPPSDWLDTPIKPFSEATEMSPEEVPEPQLSVEAKPLEANSKPFKRSGTSSSCDFTGSEDGSTTRRSFHKRRLVQKSQSRSPSISRELY